MDTIKLKLAKSKTTPGTVVYEAQDPVKVTFYAPKALIKGKVANAIKLTVEDDDAAAPDAGAAAEEPEM